MAGARRGGLSAVSVALLAPALALLGNLATNTVQVSWRWWPLTVWIVVALLLRLVVESRSRRRVVLRALRPEALLPTANGLANPPGSPWRRAGRSGSCCRR
ncbi:hypothetical protein ACSHWB_46875 [Lentzea sp. HUAS TT2]|uniref:hypothetical protein n=1 Tax=Lentzea sp. HUAS TT2 TaxID=3447454 RepID=UPI003F717CAA